MKAKMTLAALLLTTSAPALTILDAASEWKNRWTDQTIEFPEELTWGQTFVVPEDAAFLTLFTAWVIPPNPNTQYTWELREWDSGNVVATDIIAGKLPYTETASPDFLTGYFSLNVFSAIYLTPGLRYVSVWTASDNASIIAMARMSGDNGYVDGTGYTWHHGNQNAIARDFAFEATFEVSDVPEETPSVALLALGLVPLLWIARRRSLNN